MPAIASDAAGIARAALRQRRRQGADELRGSPNEDNAIKLKAN